MFDRYRGASPADVPVYVVSFEQIHAVVGFPFHRGVLACAANCLAFGRRDPPAKRRPCHAGHLPEAQQSREPGSDRADRRRFRDHAILAGPSCPDPLSRRVLRVSMGSSLRLPVIVPTGLRRPPAGWPPLSDVEFWAAVADPRPIPLSRLLDPTASPWSWETKTKGSSLTGWRDAGGRSRSRCGREPARSTCRLLPGFCSTT